MSGLTVLGNFSVDHVDERPPSPGGCPVFAAMALKELRRSGRVVGRLARGDRGLFRKFLDGQDQPISPLWTETTSGFGLRYDRGERVLTVNAVSEPWCEADIEAANIETTWVHLAPLLRNDFQAELLSLVASRGHRISFDGQGLVRAPRLGPLRLDGSFDLEILASVEVLKLNREEADALAGGVFDDAVAEQLGIAEILVTFGLQGCDLYLKGNRSHVPARPVTGVQTTGTGDAFMVSYLADRAAGLEPLAAAENASTLVADLLEERRAAEGAGQAVAREC